MKNSVLALCISLCSIQTVDAQNLKSTQIKNSGLTHELINETEFNHHKLGADQSRSNKRDFNPRILKNNNTEYGNGPEWIWAEQFGGSANDYARDIISDSAGNVYVTGSFSGEITVGLTTLVSSGNRDGFLAKFDNSGSLIWMSQLHSSISNMIESRSICLDFDGNILITGSYTGNATFSDIQLSGDESRKMFLAKYNDSGEILIAEHSDYYGIEEEGHSIAVDQDNNIFILTYGNSGDRISRFDNNGNHVWTKYGSNSPYPGSIGIKDSSLYYAGTYINDLYLDDLHLAGGYSFRTFLARADLDGHFEWGVMGVPVAEGWPDAHANGLKIDNNGFVYFFGSVRGDMVFGDDTLSELEEPVEGFIAKFSSKGTFAWARRVNKPVVDATTDSSRNIYINYEGFISKFSNDGNELLTVESENNPSCLSSDKSTNKVFLAGSNNGQIFLSRIDNLIDEEWLAKFQGNSGSGHIVGMVTDSSGFLYTYGYASSTTEYFGDTIREGMFLSKLSESGDIIWLKQLNNIHVNYGYGNYIAIEPMNDNLYITGDFDNPLIINDTIYPNENGSVFIIKYSVDGQFKWIRKEDLPGINLCISPDYSGNIILSGIFEDTIKVGNTTLISSGYRDIFITKYDTDGNPLWTHKAGGDYLEYSGQVSTDSSDNIYFTGEFLSENVTVSGTPFTMNAGDGNILFAKLDPEGNAIWITSHGGSPGGMNDDHCWPTFIKTDPRGYSYIKGWHGDNTSFNDKVLTSPYGMGYSFFIGKFDPDGNCIWVNSITKHQWCFDYNQMDIDQKGNCYLGAQVRDTIHFGDDFDYVNAGYRDLFVAKYTSDGKLSWVKTMESTSGYNWLSSVAFSKSYIYVGGYFNTFISFDDSVLLSTNRNGFIAKLGQHLCVSPNKIDFGKIEAGVDTSSRQVTIGNYGSEELIVSDISGLDSIFNFSGLPPLPRSLPPDSSFIFDIVFSPLDTMKYSDTVVVTSNDPDYPVQQIILSGEGIIVMPADSGVFYASTVPDSNQLLIIDPTSGNGITVGKFGQDNIYGLAINSQGMMYSADYNNGDLYRIDAATGTAVFDISTGLEDIVAMAFDTANVLYAVSNSQLYIIDLASGFSKPVANLGEYLMDIVFDPELGILWGASWNGNLLRIDPESGEILSILNTYISTGITGLTVDYAGNLFAISFDEDENPSLIFIDKNNGRTNIIGEVGNPYTFSLECYNVPVAGKNINVFPNTLDYGIIELGKTDTLQVYISNTGTDTVSMTGLAVPDSIFSIPDPPVLPLCIAPGTSLYLDIVFSPEDSIRYSDTLNITVDISGDTLISVLLGGRCIIIMPADPGMCYASTGYTGGGHLLQIDPETGIGTDIGPTGIEQVYSIAIDSSGNIYGADRYGGDLYRIDAASGQSLQATQTDLSNIYAMAFDSNNILYVLSSGYLYKVDPVSGDTEFIGYSYSSLTGISFDPADNSLWGITSSGYLYKIDTESGNYTYSGPFGISGNYRDLHFDYAGNLFAVIGGTYYENALVRIDPETGYSEKRGATGIQDIEGLAFYKAPIPGSHIRLFPSVIDFGSVQLDDISSNKILKISNIGTENLVIDSITLPGKTISVSGLTEFPVIIGSGLSVTLDVNFMPVVCGFVTDSLVVYCNDCDNEAVKITLTGSGTSDNCPIIVNSTGDAGDWSVYDGFCDDGNGNCTLRAAIEMANSRPGTDTIRFDIPGPGPHTIQPGSRLPAITDPVVIDGMSEPDYTGIPLIELNGSNAGEDATGVRLYCQYNIVRGLVINRFSLNGITLREGENIIHNNFIGTDITGTKDLGNDLAGIWIESSNNIIGDTTEQNRNLISCNNGPGIKIIGGNNNKIAGNFIGTDITGKGALGNGGAGISIESGNNFIGGTSEHACNVISGNESEGILILEGINTIQGNFIGPDVTGTRAIGNETGIWIGSDYNKIGGTETGAGNIISGNFTGITIMGGYESTGSNNFIRGNYIGTDVTGRVALPNEAGINIEFAASGNIIGGTEPNSGNIIAGNIWDGIAIYSVEGLSPEDNVIQGNYLGTNKENDKSLGNDRGIFIYDAFNNTIGGLDTVAANVIAHNSNNAITVVSGTGNAILSNSIFLNEGFGIDLGDNGITGNDNGDIDLGPNNLQNYPEIIRSGISNNGNLVIKYTVDSDPSNAAYPLTVQFFKTSKRNHARKLLGSHIFTETDFNQNKASADLGNANNLNIKEGGKIIATATDADGNTSELSELSIVEMFVGKEDFTEIHSGLAVYPNPFTYQSILEFPNPDGDNYTLILTDLSGKRLRIISDITSGTYVIRRESLHEGVYVIELIGPVVHRGIVVIE